MLLREALLRAAPFAAEEGPLAHVVVVPAVFLAHHPVEFVGAHALPFEPARVQATNGTTGVIIPLDPGTDVPYVAMHAGALKKVLQLLPKGADFTLAPLGHNVAVSWDGTGCSVAALPDPGAALPPLKLPGQMRAVLPQTLRSMHRVLHCAIEDPDRPLLGNVHLTPWWAEATDQNRVARTTHAGLVPHGMLVPPDLFRTWKDPGVLGVSMATVGDTLWVQIGEELRHAKVGLDADFFNLDPLLVEAPCFRAQVLGPAMVDAIKRAAKTSPINVLELVFGPGACSVAGLTADGDPSAREVIPTVGNAGDVTVRMTLRASYVRDAVTAAVDKGKESIVLKYLHASAPLRVERGPFSEMVWPLFIPEVGGTNAKDA
jgi:hypothetical protein